MSCVYLGEVARTPVWAECNQGMGEVKSRRLNASLMRFSSAIRRKMQETPERPRWCIDQVGEVPRDFAISILVYRKVARGHHLNCDD